MITENYGENRRVDKQTLEYHLFVDPNHPHVPDKDKQLYISVELAQRLQQFMEGVNNCRSRYFMKRMAADLIWYTDLFLQFYFLEPTMITSQSVENTPIPDFLHLCLIGLSILRASNWDPTRVRDSVSLRETYEAYLNYMVKYCCSISQAPYGELRELGADRFRTYLAVIREKHSLGEI